MSQLNDVNTTDIRDAIRLGCRTMQSVFSADDDRRVAFFGAQLQPTSMFSFCSWHSEAHIPGRHLNALLEAEAAAGIALDERAVETHAQAALFSFSGPLPLPLNRKAPGGPLALFFPCNLREGIYALYALTKYRHPTAARELAERCIATVLDLWTPERGWDTTRIQALGLEYGECQGFLHGEARMLGPLVKYHRVESPYPRGALRVTLKQAGVLFVRIPPWVERPHLAYEGHAQPPQWTSPYLRFAAQPVGQPLTVRFPLVEQEIELSAALHPHPIRTRLRDDEVIGMENFGGDRTFFPPLQKKSSEGRS